MDVVYRCVLLPLLGMKPPQQSLYLLVDSVDEGCNVTEGEQMSTSLSGTVAELLAGHHEFFPPWLLLLCSARKQSKAVTKMFTGKCNSYHLQMVFMDELKTCISFLEESTRLKIWSFCCSLSSVLLAIFNFLKWH